MLKSVVPGSSFDAIRRELAEKGSWIGEFRQIAKDGSEIVVEARIELDLLQDRRLVLESARDISDRDIGDRKEWERRHNACSRNSRIG